jgi:hypothetical protein
MKETLNRIIVSQARSYSLFAYRRQKVPEGFYTARRSDRFRLACQ